MYLMLLLLLPNLILYQLISRRDSILVGFHLLPYHSHSVLQ